MRHYTSRVVLTSLLAGAATVVTLAQPQMPPLKPGLWETRTVALDANGKETAPPELAALEKMPPEMRAQMMAMMKNQGMEMPDANGVTKVCLSKELLSSNNLQQIANQAGCQTTYSTQTASTWKWHSTCAGSKSEADGEAIFTNPENYKSTLKTTTTRGSQTIVQTRVVTSKWLSADCGSVKPVTPGRVPNGPAPR